MIQIIYYFVFLSFLGWLFESAYVSYKCRKPISRGMLYTPFIPIYGFVGTIILILDLKIDLNIFWWFIITGILASIAEYIVSYIAEKVFKVHLWNYKDKKFNFQGRICLTNALFFGILGSGLIIFIPILNNIFIVLPKFIWPILLVVMILDYIANFRVLLISKKEFIRELGNRNFEFKLHLHHRPVSIRTLFIKRSNLINKYIKQKLEEELQKAKHN